VFAAYVTGRAHALFDFRLYLPRSWCLDTRRRQRAHVPDEVAFATTPALGTAMLTGAASAGVPFAWAAADEVYGRSSKLREACEKGNKGYAVAVPVNFTITLPSGRRTTVAAVARLIPKAPWETRSCGPGCKGHRDYQWAWAATAAPRRWVLIRRSLTDPSDLAFFYCHGPEGRLVSLPVLIKVAGKRWPVEECVQQGKGQTGLDQHQVRTWHSFHHHTVLSMCAQALLAIAAARPAPPAASENQQPAAWRDTGELPASAGDRPPAMTPAWSRSAPPRPDASPASRPRRSAAPPATSATPGHDGDAATRPAPDGTTTTPSYSGLEQPRDGQWR
jgi:SRSO17 transposase